MKIVERAIGAMEETRNAVGKERVLISEKIQHLLATLHQAKDKILQQHQQIWQMKRKERGYLEELTEKNNVITRYVTQELLG